MYCHYLVLGGIFHGLGCGEMTNGNRYCDRHTPIDNSIEAQRRVDFNNFLCYDCGIDDSKVPSTLYEACHVQIEEFYDDACNNVLNMKRSEERLKDKISFELLGKAWDELDSTNLDSYKYTK